nr:neural proliferation differentiation and control protein 1 isoform X2 [Ciona intestinalis]XP_018668794.1 neural proliferation differentiation and control protein 1 isoform X1 [Ciona intestinalis]|eukprot:XP_018668793.1 neural proliferation differentiation and control protein 1 isoform X2 [Ciona intestinalis]
MNGGFHQSKAGAIKVSGLAKKTDYPAYGVTGPNPLHDQTFEPKCDGNLNKSAEVFHYNQTKKKIKATNSIHNHTHDHEPHGGAAEMNDEETSDGEYTVYECSGFASVVEGPMEIHNPLFEDTSHKLSTNGMVIPEQVRP